jgi:hypothetical protein
MTRDLITKRQEEQIWDLVHDHYALDPDMDRNGATYLADQVRDALRNKRHYFERQHRKALGRKFLKGLGIFAVLAALAFGVFLFVHFTTDDYAGLDKGEALDNAAGAVLSYYGENDLPSNLEVESVEKSKIFGSEAWRVDYEGTLCVYARDKLSNEDKDNFVFENCEV